MLFKKLKEFIIPFQFSLSSSNHVYLNDKILGRDSTGATISLVLILLWMFGIKKVKTAITVQKKREKKQLFLNISVHNIQK